MSFIDKFLAKIWAKKIGKDDFGNEYYVSCFKNHLGRNKRLVIYNGLDLSSKVPPMWHAWLHYMTDEFPIGNKKKFEWERDFEPNLTGTKYAYEPSTGDKSPVYIKWKP
jgi:NADH:ubiquinone oxidoreductase subunit